MWSITLYRYKQAPFVAAAAFALAIGAALFVTDHDSIGSLRQHTGSFSGSTSSSNHRHLLGPFDPKTVEPRPPLQQQHELNAMGNLERDVALCQPMSEAAILGLQKEIHDYENSKRFHQKVREVEKKKPTVLHNSIYAYLRAKVLQPGWSVLELGCAAGAMLQMVKQHYEAAGQPFKELVGVELVTGWVKFAEKYFSGSGVNVYEGDITSFTLPEHRSFDFIMLNDVMEHIQKDRYGCLFQKLREHTHEGSVVYMHVPNPTFQLDVKDQFYENILPPHFVIAGMALAHFELVSFDQDMGTVCNNDPKWQLQGNYPALLNDSKCNVRGYPRYYHAVFRRVEQYPVFTLA